MIYEMKHLTTGCFQTTRNKTIMALVDHLIIELPFILFYYLSENRNIRHRSKKTHRSPYFHRVIAKYLIYCFWIIQNRLRNFNKMFPQCWVADVLECFQTALYAIKQCRAAVGIFYSSHLREDIPYPTCCFKTWLNLLQRLVIRTDHVIRIDTSSRTFVGINESFETWPYSW